MSDQGSVVHSTFKIEREYPASPARVFSAFADPATKRRWFAEGKGSEVQEFTLDCRVGGREATRFRFKGDPALPGAPPAGTEFRNDTVYQDIAMREPDEQVALLKFDRAFAGHVRHLLKAFGRALLRSWSGGGLAPGPHSSGNGRAFRRLGRYAAALAFTSEIALLALGGSLKRRESISARLGDILSELYLLSAVLKRHHDERRPSEDAPLVQWCCESGYARIEAALAGVIANFPARPLAWVIRVITLPLGVRRCGPSDALTRACAELLRSPRRLPC